MKYRVLIIKENDLTYDIEKLQSILTKGLAFIFGKHYLNHASSVLIKPNLLMKADPDEAVTTHPHIVIALAKVLKKRGLKVSVADNPGAFGDLIQIKEIYTHLKLDTHQELFDLLYNDKAPTVKNGLPFSWWASGFDEVINLPRLKTHCLMGISGAVKNLYGLIPGIIKCKLHRDFPKANQFAKILVKIYKLTKPSVNIVDGITTLEGEGPAKQGTPRKRRLLLISNDAFALDYALAKLLNINPERDPLLRLGLKEGILDPGKIDIYPKDWQNFKINDFGFAPILFSARFLPGSIIKIISALLDSYPIINESKCKLCNKCIQTCPVSAISNKTNEKVVISKKKCIMCMCCQEVCMYGAVEKYYGPVARFLKKILK